MGCDLTNNELRGLADSTSPTVPVNERDMARELLEHRAAKAADRERVVNEVIGAFMAGIEYADGWIELPNDMVTEEDIAQAAGEAAIRVADALAVPVRPVFNEQELSQLRELRGECVVDDYPAAAQAIDRMLAAQPDPIRAADMERVGSVVADVIGNELVERKLYIVKPQQPTMGEIALEAYGHGRACDAVALLGDDLQTLLSAMAKRVAEELCKP